MRTARPCTWQWCRRVTARSTARGEAVAMPCGRGHLRDRLAALPPGDASCHTLWCANAAAGAVRRAAAHPAAANTHGRRRAALGARCGGDVAAFGGARDGLRGDDEAREQARCAARLLRLCAGCCSVGQLTRQAACGRRAHLAFTACGGLSRSACVDATVCVWVTVRLRTWPWHVCVCVRGAPAMRGALVCTTSCSRLAPP